MSKLHDAIRTAGELAPSTRERYLRDVTLFVEYAGENADRWTANQLGAFRYHLTNTRRFTPGNIDRILSSIRTAMQLVATPALTDEQVAKLLATCDPSAFERLDEKKRDLDRACDLRDRAIITCIVETGINRAQLLDLKIDTVLSEYDGVHALTKPAREGLAPWLAWLLKYATSGPLFRPLMTNQPHQFGQSMTAAGLQKMLSTRGTAAGIGHINVQMLRRVHARRNA